MHADVGNVLLHVVGLTDEEMDDLLRRVEDGTAEAATTELFWLAVEHGEQSGVSCNDGGWRLWLLWALTERWRDLRGRAAPVLEGTDAGLLEQARATAPDDGVFVHLCLAGRKGAAVRAAAAEALLHHRHRLDSPAAVGAMADRIVTSIRAREQGVPF